MRCGVFKNAMLIAALKNDNSQCGKFGVCRQWCGLLLDPVTEKKREGKGKPQIGIGIGTSAGGSDRTDFSDR